jgi:CubicO group peptidase (beta-lactamase class C family)
MRATVLAVSLIAVAGVLSACTSTGISASTGAQPAIQARPVLAGPAPILRDGSAASVGLNPAPVAAAQQRIAAGTQPIGRRHPMYAGEVSLVAHDGVVVSRQAAGYELRYADGRGIELPPQQQEKTTTHTIFDLASLTKLFTSIAVMQLVEDGRVRLDAPAAKYVPEFAANGKGSVTVEQLLTHTSGLQAKIELWKLPPQQRIPAVLQATPRHAPGTAYVYSDLNMITLGVLVERVSGRPLDQVVHDRITAPLGMTDTGFHPPPTSLHRIAATEFETDPPRGMVRGQVQDENAWSLGGVAGEAGMFSTADDLAILGQTMLNGGSYGKMRILRPDTVHAMLTNYNTAFPGHAHGLGFELNQRSYMAGLSGPQTAGHTGFTGTSLVIDPVSRSIVILLTNAVHPSRTWDNSGPARRALAQGVADSLRAAPPQHA